MLFALVGCGDPVGTPCEIVGDGFHARHDCEHRCLSRWQITCPSGAAVTPDTCSGAFGCTPGSCPSGSVCYADDDPFDDRSFCVVADACGPLDAAALADWERRSLARQKAVIAERAAREARKAAWQAEHPDAVTAPGATRP
ncbi:MAG: hypothetical protein NXI30_07650 [bacterium]|nr:hypothetical protein [bacterium]